MILTKNFTLEEMCASDTARRLGIINTPGEVEVENLQALCENVLQPLRDSIGRPIAINSGYRSVALNRAVGGSMKSQHLKGEAADLSGASGLLRPMFAAIIEEGLPFDQLIWENTWVHLSYSRVGNRGQILRYHPARNGKGSWYEDISGKWKKVLWN